MNKKLLIIIISTISIVYVVTVIGLIVGISLPNNGYKSVIIDKNNNNNTKPTALSLKQDTKSIINYRLPTDLSPYYYILNVSTKFNDEQEPLNYNGSVKIYFKCINSTNKIILHVRSLNILNNTIKISDDENIEKFYFINLYYQFVREFFVIELNSYLEINKNYSVYIEYNGLLKDDMTGFYRSSYLDNNGKKRWLFSSQMESTDARKAFPCFDEPALKAKFKIIARHHKNYTALSNMPVVSRKTLTNDIDYVETQFDETFLMSTYIIALIISDFKCKEKIANAGVDGKLVVGVCARPNAYNQLDYALDSAVSIIEFFEKYFGIKYPLPKIDHVAIPDLLFHAMENWGVVTYRENFLLRDPSRTSLLRQQYIDILIAHEISHNWFGNLVTPKWWNDLWLNEGFATYLDYFGVENTKSSFGMFEQFVQAVLEVMDIDSKETTHSLSYKCNSPDEIWSMFDDISYSKGGSILRMMNYFLSNETFAAASILYLNQNSYNVVDQDDLWKSFQQQIDREGKFKINIKNIMNTWTRQAGYPVVHVSLINQNTIKLTQNRFLKDPSRKLTSNSKWYVPFSFSNERIGIINNNLSNINMNNLYKQIVWMVPEINETIIKLDTPVDKNNFILGNLDLSGFYRVNYDHANWNKIILQLNTKYNAIPSKNRALLIDDTFNLVKAELLNVNTSLNLISYLNNETEYLPWVIAIKHLQHILYILEDSEVYGDFNKYLYDLVEDVYMKLGWNETETDSWLDKLLRRHILSIACKIGISECVNKSMALYTEMMQNSSIDNIPLNYRSIIYCTSIYHGTEKHWEFAYKQFINEKDPYFQHVFQIALSCSKEPWLMKRYLNDQLNEKIVRRVEGVVGINEAVSSPLATSVVWNFFKANWNTLYSKYSAHMPVILTTLASRFNSEFQLNEFETFFEKQKGFNVTGQVEEIQSNIRWLKRNINEIRKFFKK